MPHVFDVLCDTTSVDPLPENLDVSRSSHSQVCPHKSKGGDIRKFGLNNLDDDQRTRLALREVNIPEIIPNATYLDSFLRSASVTTPRLISPHLSQAESLADILEEKWVGMPEIPLNAESFRKSAPYEDDPKGGRSPPFKSVNSARRKTRSSSSFANVSPHKIHTLRHTLPRSRHHNCHSGTTCRSSELRPQGHVSNIASPRAMRKIPELIIRRASMFKYVCAINEPRGSLEQGLFRTLHLRDSENMPEGLWCGPAGAASNRECLDEIDIEGTRRQLSRVSMQDDDDMNGA
ncbi:hypothetical protein BD311DRAFT_377237 [Dichomitus squalens]|uniref:Uncharacterized protein n=1 Tax=Dichomitus squalens TaxID=114155 RepID=A0A4Q9MMF2_9APHY|nr:hypothetical protein BD311DRAFT_377237 [Dichomitus squalens]